MEIRNMYTTVSFNKEQIELWRKCSIMPFSQFVKMAFYEKINELLKNQTNSQQVQL